ncbi:hypothetical protein LIER_15396 [Lithospermum erythrorhizon]|uniref:Uncharacterized protein n=1 Tax=Lithospermum erythrorhizon TaxID=34254 RepID=A0AAV3Q2S3_LITER
MNGEVVERAEPHIGSLQCGTILRARLRINQKPLVQLHTFPPGTPRVPSSEIPGEEDQGVDPRSKSRLLSDDVLSVLETSHSHFEKLSFWSLRKGKSCPCHLRDCPVLNNITQLGLASNEFHQFIWFHLSFRREVWDMFGVSSINHPDLRVSGLKEEKRRCSKGISGVSRLKA